MQRQEIQKTEHAHIRPTNAHDLGNLAGNPISEAQHGVVGGVHLGKHVLHQERQSYGGDKYGQENERQHIQGPCHGMVHGSVKTPHAFQVVGRIGKGALGILRLLTEFHQAHNDSVKDRLAEHGA